MNRRTSQGYGPQYTQGTQVAGGLIDLISGIKGRKQRREDERLTKANERFSRMLEMSKNFTVEMFDQYEIPFQKAAESAGQGESFVPMWRIAKDITASRANSTDPQKKWKEETLKKMYERSSGYFKAGLLSRFKSLQRAIDTADSIEEEVYLEQVMKGKIKPLMTDLERKEAALAAAEIEEAEEEDKFRLKKKWERDYGVPAKPPKPNLTGANKWLWLYKRGDATEEEMIAGIKGDKDPPGDIGGGYDSPKEAKEDVENQAASVWKQLAKRVGAKPNSEVDPSIISNKDINRLAKLLVSGNEFQGMGGARYAAALTMLPRAVDRRLSLDNLDEEGVAYYQKQAMEIFQEAVGRGLDPASAVAFSLKRVDEAIIKGQHESS